jgi:hypothetical protein
MLQVAAAGLRGHMGSVPKALTILLALVALLLMPMGMSGTPAAAASPDDAALAGHCDSHGTEKDQVPGGMEQHCATCLVMPAAEGPRITPGLAPRAPRSLMAACAFQGLGPEVSTPPPRRA